ncbi:hypothetical protein Ahy_B06g081150 [Arachis hypogaea]|uniref:Uncharacterized protein n=1 Tax=Arachis hypogaea TaxID=3818 RepID=A0A444YKC1_ARAHY|nr:hypothetical protein Ahy_B06g081150 [Arachis hypogaea]
MIQFGTIPTAAYHKGSGVKLAWLRTLKWLMQLDTALGRQIWGSACLPHLYRALCQVSRFDCKDVDDPLALLCLWAWECLPFLAPVWSQQSFPLACSLCENPYSHDCMRNIVIPNDIL